MRISDVDWETDPRGNVGYLEILPDKEVTTSLDEYFNNGFVIIDTDDEGTLIGIEVVLHAEEG